MRSAESFQREGLVGRITNTLGIGGEQKGELLRQSGAAGLQSLFQGILSQQLNGCWNVSFIEDVILIDKNIYSNILFKNNGNNICYTSFVNNNISNNIFMYIDNMINNGFIE